MERNIKVICRFRPISDKQKVISDSICHQVITKNHVQIKDNKNQTYLFQFDQVLDIHCNQSQTYQLTARPIVQNVLQGFNGTIFAYGQTSSGKTYTIQGQQNFKSNEKGIIPRMIDQVFKYIEQTPQHIQFRMKVSMVQLYMEKFRDLFDVSKTDMKIRSDVKRGIYIESLTQTYISQKDEIMKLIKFGNHNRACHSTNMNERSSRSHMIFILTISQNNLQNASAKTGKLYLVDLAGSQRINKSLLQGKLLEQSKKINLSLVSLGKVINSLIQKSPHIPYRDSKLTRVLQESLGGNSKTLLIVTCSSHPSNYSQTLSTLRFGSNAKQIKNKAIINRQITVGQMQRLLEQCQKLNRKKDDRIKKLQQFIQNEMKINVNEVIKESTNLLEVDQDLKKTNVNPEFYEERIRILQEQLEAERTNVRCQTEKLNQLRSQYTQTSSQYIMLQQQYQQQKKLISQHVIQKQKLKQKIDELECERQMILKKQEDLSFQGGIYLNTHQNSRDQDKYLQKLELMQEMYEEQKNKREKYQEVVNKNQEDQKKNVHLLEKNIKYFAKSVYELLNAQTKWKMESQILEKKLKRKNNEIKQLQEQIQKLNNQLESMRKKQQNGPIWDQDQGQIYWNKKNYRLVKPVKGGSIYK